MWYFTQNCVLWSLCITSLKEIGEEEWTGSNPGYGQVVSCCECSSETSGCIKGGACFDWLKLSDSEERGYLDIWVRIKYSCISQLKCRYANLVHSVERLCHFAYVKVFKWEQLSICQHKHQHSSM